MTSCDYIALRTFEYTKASSLCLRVCVCLGDRIVTVCDFSTLRSSVRVTEAAVCVVGCERPCWGTVVEAGAGLGLETL